MFKYRSFRWLLILLIWGVSCKPVTNEDNSPAEVDTLLMDSISEADQLSADLACLMQAGVICELGLKVAPLGQPILQLPGGDLAEAEARDFVQETEAYAWFERTITLSEGQLILEGDFIDNRATDLETQLAESKLNRIRIESPLFKTPEGIQVGDRIDTLMNRIGGEMVLTPLPNYGVIDLQPVSRRLHFLIPATAEELSDEAVVLPNDRQIKAIVVL